MIEILKLISIVRLWPTGERAEDLIDVMDMSFGSPFNYRKAQSIH